MGVKAEEIEEFPVLPYEPTAEQRSAAFWMVRYVRDNGDFRGAGVSKIAIKFTWNVVPTRGKPYKKILRCGLEYYGSTLPVSFSGYAVTWSVECVYETDVPSVQRVVVLKKGEAYTQYRYDDTHPLYARLKAIKSFMGTGGSFATYGGTVYPPSLADRRLYLSARVVYNILVEVPDLTDDQNTVQYDRAKYLFVKGYLGEDIAQKYFRRVFDQMRNAYDMNFSVFDGVNPALMLRLYEAAGQELTGFSGYYNNPAKSKYMQEFLFTQYINNVKLRSDNVEQYYGRARLIADTLHLMEQCKMRKLFTWRQLRDMSKCERLKRFHDLLSYAIRDDDKRNAKRKYKNAPGYQYNDMCVEIYNTVRDIVLKYDPAATVSLPPSPLYIVNMGIDQKHCVGSYVDNHTRGILVLEIVWHGKVSSCGINISCASQCNVIQWYGVSNSVLTPETDRCVAEIDSVLPDVYSRFKPQV